jgi:hypothetical protein
VTALKALIPKALRLLNSAIFLNYLRGLVNDKLF